MKFFQFIVILMIAASPAFAQQEKTGRKTAEQRTAMITKNLTEKLSLSSSQADSISDVVLKREKLRDAGKLTDAKKKETDKEIKKILTKEQHEKWMKHREEVRAKAKQKGKEKGKSEQPSEFE